MDKEKKESLWLSECTDLETERLSGDIRTDVLVIGGGLAGLLTAYQLQQRGISAVVVEKDRICQGISGHTTAKITAQHGFIYSEIQKTYGQETGALYYGANKRAVEQLKQLCGKAGCPLEEKTNVVFSSDPLKIEKELSAMEKMGIPGQFISRVPFLSEAAGGVGLDHQAQFHPWVLARYLAENLKIYEHTKVTQLEGMTAQTDGGRIRAEKIVVATHFPFLNKHGMYFLKLYQHRSYLMALENAPVLDAMYVDESKTGYSFSSFDGWFLLGGGGHRTGKQGGAYQALTDFAETKLPGAKTHFCWSAQDTMSLDGIPYIGLYSPSVPNVYVAAGFNKWGMTGAMVSAEIISGMIAGDPPREAEVFCPQRRMLHPQLFVNGFESGKNLLVPTTKRCPHLGCGLKYNKEEHSWDCPCHGSRFSESGKLLDNPANDDLKKP